MKVNISYSDYLNEYGKEEIDSISIALEDNKILEFKIVLESTEVTNEGLENEAITLIPSYCNISLIDNTTVTQVDSVLNKDDFSELIALIRKVSVQL